MNKPKIQIIIPVYNGEKYLRECLDSITMQSYTNWQAIIVDDASTDGSVDIINEYVKFDKRFMLISQEKNCGVSHSRNTALSKLNAKYVAFIDADDWWEYNMLETLVTKAEEYNSDVVQCRFVYNFPGGKQVLPKGAFSNDVVLNEKSLKAVYIKMMTGINMNHVCMKLIRTDLIYGLKFDSTLKTAEDLNFCIELFQKVKSYCFVNKVLYHYRRNANSLTGIGLPFREKLEANIFVSKQMVRALPKWGIDNVFYKLLSYSRPYILIFSKAFRMIREKFITSR